MKDKYILDSSIWIELERKNSKISNIVLPWLQQNQVALIDLIMAEVLRGCRSEKDYKTLANAFENFPVYSTNWTTVAKLGYKLSKAGYQPPLSDLYIAQCVIDNDKILVTQDKHFKQMQNVLELKLVSL